MSARRKLSRSRACPGLVPGPGADSANKGKGKERKKEGREGKRGREGAGVPAARKGAGLRRGWMDGSIDGQGREESKRLSGGRERKGAGKIRRGNGTKESHGQQWLEFVF